MRNLKKATDTASEASAASSPSVTPAPSTGPLAFTAPAKDLAKVLRSLAGFSDPRSSMPMLGCVAIRATGHDVSLVATDLNKSAVYTAPGWHVHGTGSIAVNAKALGALLRKLPPGDVTLRGRAGAGGPPKLEIAQGSLSFVLDAMPAQDFPKIPAILPEDKVLTLARVDAAQIGAMIDAVRVAVCKDESRFHLNGILFESTPNGSRMVATDGHRLHKVEGAPLPAFALPPMIIPNDAAAELRKALAKGDIEIGTLGDSVPKLVARIGGLTMALKSSDAQFPPYDQVIPKDHRRLVTLDRAALASALERSLLLSSDTRGVRLECVPDGLKLTADHPDLGTASETIPADLNPASSFAVGVNPRFLIEALAPIDDERVTLAFGAELDPAIIRGTTDAVSRSVSEASYLAVVMPMRI